VIARTCFLREKFPLCVKEKVTTIKVGSDWIAVLRLFRDSGWDKLGALSGRIIEN